MYQLVEWKPYREKPEGLLIADQIGIVKQLENKELKEASYIEEDYRIRLKETRQRCPAGLDDNIIVASIGEVVASSQEEGDYDLITHRFREPRRFTQYIRVTSQKHFIRVTDYLRCLVDLVYEAIKEEKQLVVYVEIEKLDECYEYRSLWDKAINLFIREVPVLIIHKTDKEVQPYYIECEKRFEPYEEKRIYTSEGLASVLDNMRRKLYEDNRQDMPRENSLYNDVFISKFQILKKSMFQ